MSDPHESASLLARAFHHDPFIRWADPDPGRRPRTMARVFAGLIRHAARAGGRLLRPGVGAALWRDGHAATLGPLAVATSGTWQVALVAPPPVWLRLAAHEEASMARVRPFLTAGAAYLCALAVEPGRAGQGHGGGLLREALAEMARHWTTCVLRTEQPRNLPFYRRHGFVQVDEHLVAESGLRVWVFARALRPSSG